MKLTATFLLFAAALSASTINTTATLVSVNGTSVGGNYTGPYTEDIGGVDLQVFCADPNADTPIGQSYAATVTVGDVVPGWSQQELDEIYGIIGLSGTSDDPVYQEAIWHVVDPTDWLSSTAINAIIAEVAATTVYPNGFELIQGVNEQPFVAVITPTSEAGTLALASLGIILALVGRRWADALEAHEAVHGNR